ncbi:MAG: DUF302 domain-containing protein [Pseudomonadota bacterium]
MRGHLFAFLIAGSLALPVAAVADLITKSSPYPVGETMDRLETAVTGAGATVFARVDHAVGAASVEMDLRPTQLLIFGNPKLGTPAMQDAQAAGLDLPLRVVVFETAEGVTTVAYHDPAALAETHGLPADAQYIKMMTGALDKLTGAAVAAD